MAACFPQSAPLPGQPIPAGISVFRFSGCPLEGTPYKRKHSPPADRAEQVDDHNQHRHGYADPPAKKPDGDGFQVLHAEYEDRDRKQHQQ